MKRIIASIMIGIMLMVTCAHAEYVVDKDYTDTPTAMTQDSVLRAEASQGCTVDTLLPSEESVALLEAIYDFVWREGKPPARFFDDETRQELQKLMGGVDIDTMHMSEMILMEVSGDPKVDVTVEMLLDVDYRPGQTVAMVLGLQQEDGSYEWYPYRARVESLGLIKWDIPVEEWKELRGQPMTAIAMTNRFSARGDIIYNEEVEPSHETVFSRDSRDVINVYYWYSSTGEPIDDKFRVWIADLTEDMQAEVARIGEHLSNGGAILDYFPEERREEALLMLPETVDPQTLIAYDVIALMCENYKDTYGDVNVEVVFGTSYDPHKAMVILAGFPIPDATEAPYMEWYVLNTEALTSSGSVEIGLKQLNLIRMGEEPIMLVVISEPIDQQ